MKKHKERQYASMLKDIRRDHINRYKIAIEFIQKMDSVLDIACGIGYGSYMIAKNSNVKEIYAFDRSKEAVCQGKKCFSHPKINYVCENIKNLEKKVKEIKFDVICSIETIEHIDGVDVFLLLLNKFLKEDGIFIVSTPNNDVRPYVKADFPFHKRHYSSNEFISMLNKYGFYIDKYYTQVDSEVFKGFGGWINIAVCKRKKIVSKKQISLYLDLLKQYIKGKKCKDFIKQETINMFRYNKKKEFLLLAKEWLIFDSKSAYVLYLLGCYYEEQGIMAKARFYFKKSLGLKVTDKNKKFIVSSCFHLAKLYKNNKNKIEILKKCLKIEKKHKKAKSLINQLENI